MAHNIKYFAYDGTPLTDVFNMHIKSFIAAFGPTVGTVAVDAHYRWVGRVPGTAPKYNNATKSYDANMQPVARKVRYKTNPSKHECDARCINATGRTMQCECACGGANHGKGRFNCT